MKVTVAGAAQQASATPLKVKSFSVQAHESNAGNIYVGQDAAAIASGARHVLSSNASMSIEVDYQYGDEDQVAIDLSQVYIHGNSPADIAVISYVEIEGVVY